jgi:regulatory protein
MAILTKLDPSTYSPGYLKLEVDGAPLGTVSKRIAAQLGLEEGMPLSEEDLEELRKSTGIGAALALANHFLAHRPRTVAEVRTRFRRAQFEPEIIEGAIAELQRQGLLDDQRFAALWIENRSTFSPRSSRSLEQELRRKGVERDIVEQTVEKAELGDEATLAFEAGQKRLRSMASLDEETFRRRMGGFLARRGFAYEATSTAIERLWAESRGSD